MRPSRASLPDYKCLWECLLILHPVLQAVRIQFFHPPVANQSKSTARNEDHLRCPCPCLARRRCTHRQVRCRQRRIGYDFDRRRRPRLQLQLWRISGTVEKHVLTQTKPHADVQDRDRTLERRQLADCSGSPDRLGRASLRVACGHLLTFEQAVAPGNRIASTGSSYPGSTRTWMSNEGSLNEVGQQVGTCWLLYLERHS
jgi:hypothetical protein